MGKIPVSGPWVTDLEVEYVKDAAQFAWHENANLYNLRFEKAFSTFVGVDYAACLPSCTSAIHLALSALGVGPGDEVIVPDITWIASAAPVSYVGAKLVLADIDPDTWCVSLESIQLLYTENTKAIIVVDLYGNMPDYEKICNWAKKVGVYIIEDAAEAFGSKLAGKFAGSYGDIGVFSFHGSKTMTTGEGGMLVTNHKSLFERVQFLRDHGRVPGDVSFQNSEVAFKYKMSSMQAAFGLAQVERAKELVKKKRAIYYLYQDCLNDIPGISLNGEISGGENSFWMTTIVLDNPLLTDKFLLVNAMGKQGVDCRPFFSPLSSLSAYQDLVGVEKYKKNNRIGYDISSRGINLPSGLSLTQKDIEFVVQKLRLILSI